MSAPPITAPSGGPPNCTVYVRNLEESIKLPLLVTALRGIFSPYGEILDIVAKRSLKNRGQAFVVFSSVSAAQKAIEEVQAFPLFNKPMVLAFAKTVSDATVKREQGEGDEWESHKRRRLAEKERKQAVEAAEKARAPQQETAQDAAAAAKKKVGGGLKSTAPAGAPVVPDEYLPPNTTLFLRDLPDETEEDTLTGLFGRYDGFKEVRMVPGRKGIAFVEFEAIEGAIAAKEGMGGMQLGDKVVRVTYQRQ